MSLQRSNSVGKFRRKSSQSSGDITDIDPKAEERSAKFKTWLLRKSLHDRAVELLKKISITRSEYEEDLKEVAIALCAVEALLLSGSNAVDDNGSKPGNNGKKSGPMPLSAHWMKWGMEAHNFNMVPLSDDDVASLSAAVHEYLDTTDDGKKVLPSLKYFFPAVAKKPNEKAKPLTDDQKVQNTLYMKEMRRVWKEAKLELKSRVKEFIARKVQQMMKSSEAGHDIHKLELRLEQEALSEMSLKKMNLWVEEDEDKVNKKSNEDEQERMKVAKSSHEQWVRSKDG